MRKSTEFGISLLIIGVIIPCAAALAQDIEFVSTCFPRWANVSKTLDSFVYLTVNDSLFIVDISNPWSPTLTGICDSAGGNCLVEANYAYLALGECDEEQIEKYLRVADVADPAHPATISNFIPIECPTGIGILGSYVYMSEFDPFLLDGWLEVVNVYDPRFPEQVAAVHFTGFPTCVSLDSNIALVGLGYEEPYLGQIRILDIQNPSMPLQVGNCETPEWPQRIHMSRNYAYVADGFSGLRIIDFGDPANPFEVGNYETAICALDVSVDGALAFVADDTLGLQVLDISDPHNPCLAQVYAISGHTKGVFALNNYLFVSNSDSVVILRIIPSSTGDSLDIPSAYSLLPAYPNPFNAQTTMRFTLPKAGPVTLDIYDILGRKIGTTFSGYLEAGEHGIVWDAGDLPSGLYFYMLNARGRNMAGKMTLLK